MNIQWIRIGSLACMVAVGLALTGCDSEQRENQAEVAQVPPARPAAAAQADEPQSPRPDFWEPISASPSTIAPEQIRDEYWSGQFERINGEVAQAEGTQLVFFGDSITKSWTLLNANGKAVWDEHFAKYKPINMGNSGDITPVMLYRATQGNLDFAEGQAPRVAVLLCGTNNYGVNQSDGGRVKWELGMDTPPGEVADGVRAIAQAFCRHLPTTRVIVLGILPVKKAEKWAKCKEVNRILAGYDYPQDQVRFLDLQEHFMNADGTLKADLYTDGTHLTPAGYAVMADALLPEIERLMAL